MESVFLPCKESALAEIAINKGVADLQKLGDEYGRDTAMLTSLPSSLSKEPASRGDLDLVVNHHQIIQIKVALRGWQVEDELQKGLYQLMAQLNKAERARQSAPPYSFPPPFGTAVGKREKQKQYICSSR